MDASSARPSLLVDVWSSHSGSVHFPRLEGLTATESCDAILAAIAPQCAVAAEDPTVCDRLLDRSARQVRHLFTMRHDLEVLPAETRVPDLELRPWRKEDAALLAPALLAAYDAEHPDAEEVDLEAAVNSLVGTTEDADNPLMSSATQVALLGGQTIGAALVLRSEHEPLWSGPWLQNVFRAPDRTRPGVGVAMLTRAMTILKGADERQLGLAVTSTNPAVHVYERLGFVRVAEYWIVVLPEPA